MTLITPTNSPRTKPFMSLEYADLSVVSTPGTLRGIFVYAVAVVRFVVVIIVVDDVDFIVKNIVVTVTDRVFLTVATAIII